MAFVRPLTCPVTQLYADRLQSFAAKYAREKGRVALVGISVDSEKEEQLPELRAYVEKKGFTHPILFDASQQIAKDFGARKTVEVVVLDKQRKVIYTGAVDDDYTGENVKRRYLVNAVEAALNGAAPDVAETYAVLSPVISVTIRNITKMCNVCKYPHVGG